MCAGSKGGGSAPGAARGRHPRCAVNNSGETCVLIAAVQGFEAELVAEAGKVKRCAACGAGGKKLTICTQCRVAAYCGADCQKATSPAAANQSEPGVVADR